MSTTKRPVVLFVDDEAGNLTAFNAAFRRTSMSVWRKGP